MRNSFNLLIIALCAVNVVFCGLLVADFSMARAFELHTVLYTLLYPYAVYPLTNIMLSASIYLTVVLGLERYIAVCYPLKHRYVGRRDFANPIFFSYFKRKKTFESAFELHENTFQP